MVKKDLGSKVNVTPANPPCRNQRSAFVGTSPTVKEEEHVLSPKKPLVGDAVQVAGICPFMASSAAPHGTPRNASGSFHAVAGTARSSPHNKISGMCHGVRRCRVLIAQTSPSETASAVFQVHLGPASGAPSSGLIDD